MPQNIWVKIKKCACGCGTQSHMHPSPSREWLPGGRRTDLYQYSFRYQESMAMCPWSRQLKPDLNFWTHSPLRRCCLSPFKVNLDGFMDGFRILATDRSHPHVRSPTSPQLSCDRGYWWVLQFHSPSGTPSEHLCITCSPQRSHVGSPNPIKSSDDCKA